MTSFTQNSPHLESILVDQPLSCEQQGERSRHFLQFPLLKKGWIFLIFLLLVYGFWFSMLASAADEVDDSAPPIDTSAVAPVDPTGGQAPFHIIATDPQPSAFAGVILTDTVSATFDGELDTNTIAANLLIRGHQQGRFNGAFSYDSGTKTVTFTPDRRFAFGEQIDVVGTNQVRNSTSDSLTPYQWSFKAGHIQERCVEGFLEIGDFIPVWSSASAWGDFDRDGDLDIIVAGKPVGSPITLIYRNDGNGNFTKLDVGIAGVREAAIALGDYDNDYDLDVLIAGTDSFGLIVTRIYRNDGPTTFTNINAPFVPVTRGGVSWVDYNSDGLADVFLHGDTNSGSTVRLYQNLGNNQFTEVTTSLPGLNNSAIDWADYDNDGDPDLLLTGIAATGFVSRIYNNNGGLFTDIGAGLQAVGDSAVAWGDYDGDGDEDILLSGETSQGNPAPVTRIYRNDSGVFTNINAGLKGVLDGSVDWSDFDNDGDLDILVSGKDAAEAVSTTLYENQAGSFAVFPTNLPSSNLGSLAWGDFDGDFDADILLTGFSVSGALVFAAGQESNIVTGLFQNYDCPSDVYITQTVVPTTALNSQPVTITLNFGNLGPVTATEVLLQDVVPTGINITQIMSSTTGPLQIVDTGKIPGYEWRVSDMLVGQGGTITLTGSVDATPGSVYTNTAKISAAKDITFTNNLVTQTVVTPFRVTQTSPNGGDRVSVPLDEPIAMTFEIDIFRDSVSAQTLRLYGSHSGFLGHGDATYNSGTRTYQVRADRDFSQGEQVTVIGTKKILSRPGAPLVPYQWQFTAGEISNRVCG